MYFLSNKKNYKYFLLSVMLSFCSTRLPAMDWPQSALDIKLRNAVKQDQTEIVQELLNAHADPNAKNKHDGMTALMKAVNAGNMNLVQLLLDNHADPNIQDDWGRTVLMHAAVKNNKEIVEILLNTHVMNVNAQDNKDKTALGLTSNNDITQLLLDNHANFDLRYNNGRTVLMDAVYFGFTEKIRTLLNAKADVNVQDNQGQTALMIVSKIEPARLLLNNHADLSLRDNRGRSAIEEITQLLGNRGAGIIQLFRNYINLWGHLLVAKPENLHEITTEIIRNDFAIFLKPLLTLEIVRMICTRQELRSLTISDGYVEHLIKDYKEKFITLFLLFRLESQESKSWYNLPVELIDYILLAYELE